MKDLYIAVVWQKYNPYGGVERFVERELGALSQIRVDITVVSWGWDTGKPGYQYVLCNPFYIGRLWRDMSFANLVCRKLEGLAKVLLGFNSSFHPAEAGSSVRAKVEAHSLNAMADKLVDFYNQLIGNHS